MRARLLILPAFLLLAACGGKDKGAALEEGQSAEILYARASQAMDSGDEEEAARLFGEIEHTHPYSPWAARAELMGAYAAYDDGRYEEALDGAERYISLHPASQGAAYAWYLRALSYYMQINDVYRDQAATRRALGALNDVIARYPDTDYARDAKIKRDLSIDHLAGKEMEVGRYYLRQGHLGAAIGRFSMVVENYQVTTHAAEALYRLVEIYTMLGVKNEATRMAAVLGHNYPGSRWYARAYKLLEPGGRQALLEERGWVERTADDLLGPGEEDD